jgi:hypothetical protein
MEFNAETHQKIRYQKHLYVVFIDEYPDILISDANEQIVLHPIWKDWIVRITSPSVRQLMTVCKADCSFEDSATLQ